MCSTLILGDISAQWNRFIRQLRHYVKDAENEETKDTKWVVRRSLDEKDSYGRNLAQCYQYSRQHLDSHKVNHFAFVIATTIYTEVAENMTKYGFVKVGREYNSKNMTTCDLWVMSASEFVKRLEDFDENGNLKTTVTVSEETTCVASAA